MNKDKLYFISMPAGHCDFISQGTSLAMATSYLDMLHYVHFYHLTRKDSYDLPGGKVEGPIKVVVS